MVHARPTLAALFGAFLLWSILGCSGLTPVDRLPHVAAIEIEPGKPFDLRFESNGQPLDIWLRYDVAYSRQGYLVHADLQHRVGAERRHSSQVTIDKDGVHHGSYSKPSYQDSPGMGRAVRSFKILSSASEPTGTPVRIVGTVTSGPHTEIKRVTLVVTN